MTLQSDKIWSSKVHDKYKCCHQKIIIFYQNFCFHQSKSGMIWSMIYSKNGYRKRVRSLNLWGRALKYTNTSMTLRRFNDPLVLSFRFAILLPVFWFWFNCINVLETEVSGGRLHQHEPFFKNIIMLNVKNFVKELDWKTVCSGDST